MAWTDGEFAMALRDPLQRDGLAAADWRPDIFWADQPGIAGAEMAHDRSAGDPDLAGVGEPLSGDPIVLDEMPAYDWYHGCAPTAAAMLLAYWDLHVDSRFFDAEGWDEISLTANVAEQISSAAHNARYDPLRDVWTLPDPPDTSLADFLHTSEGTLGFGSTWLSQVDPGIEGYTAWRGHPLDADSLSFGAVSRNDIVVEIDAGRPMLFHVDSDGNGSVDHTMAVLGYEDRGAEGLWYGSYTTWREDETVEWFPFRPMTAGDAFGVYGVTFVHEAATSLIA
jgi:hypothetical protein